MSVDNSDTRLWKVDHLKLLSQYIAAMVALPFALRALEEVKMTDQKSQSVLVVGLGGGSLDMFLHTKFPSVENLPIRCIIVFRY